MAGDAVAVYAALKNLGQVFPVPPGRASVDAVRGPQWWSEHRHPSL